MRNLLLRHLKNKGAMATAITLLGLSTLLANVNANALELAPGESLETCEELIEEGVGRIHTRAKSVFVRQEGKRHFLIVDLDNLCLTNTPPQSPRTLGPKTLTGGTRGYFLIDDQDSLQVELALSAVTDASYCDVVIRPSETHEIGFSKIDYLILDCSSSSFG